MAKKYQTKTRRSRRKTTQPTKGEVIQVNEKQVQLLLTSLRGRGRTGWKDGWA
jgi:hypothetical protein